MEYGSVKDDPDFRRIISIHPKGKNMPDIILTVGKVKKHKLATLKKWFRTIKVREREAAATLKAEHIFTESAFLHRFGKENFLIYYTEAENFKKALSIFNKSKRKIDKEHDEVLRDTVAWQTPGPKLLLHLKQNSRR